MAKIKLLIAEDHPFTRQTLAYEFKKMEEIEFKGAFENGKDAFEYCLLNDVDVILMDITMPVMDGIIATKEIKKIKPNTKIIILTSHKEKENVLDSLSSGANAYCVKNIKTPELLEIIKTVYDGGVFFDKEIAAYILDIFKTIEKQKMEEKLQAEVFHITQAERTVLKLIADGYTNAQISETLFLAKSTVKNHVSNIIKKLNVKDRTQIALFTVKNNLLD